MRKSGCNLPLDMVEEEIKITTYESAKRKLEYRDIAPKEWSSFILNQSIKFPIISKFYQSNIVD